MKAMPGTSRRVMSRQHRHAERYNRRKDAVFADSLMSSANQHAIGIILSPNAKYASIARLH